MRIGAAILNFNGREMLLQSLASLMASTRVPDRICVVDNASTDGSAAAIRTAYPDIHVIELPRNLGGPAINAGFEWLASQGCDVLWKLDNDIEADPRCVELLEQAARQHPRAMLSPLIFYADPPGKVWFAGGHVDWTKMNVRHVEDVEQFRQLPQRDRILTGCASWIPIAVFRSIGGYDPHLFLYGDDTDFSMRAVKAGFSQEVVPEARLIHRINAATGGSQSHNSPVRAYHIFRSTLLLWRKHLGFWAFHRRWCPVNLWKWTSRDAVWWADEKNRPKAEAFADAIWFYLRGMKDATCWPPAPDWFRVFFRRRAWVVGALMAFDLKALFPPIWRASGGQAQERRNTHADAPRRH